MLSQNHRLDILILVLMIRRHFICFQKKDDRKSIALLGNRKKVKVAQLAERFNVTLETIRSDLKYLENEGLIKRCHGGAILGKQEIKKISKFSDSFDISCLLHDLLIVKEHKKKTPEGKVCVLGSFVVDIIANVDAFPRVGELVNSKGNSIGPGGKRDESSHFCQFF
ncbi:carbohydrate kinase/trancriptional regulator [Proteus mirabilis]|uniref:Carbohydrate kinase/trancriptional regulator n=1 Tax=Proteus mirabilis TaxID=584 RepID=A0A2X2E8X1_PROMI|nr:carbohydrate kinase/trancriptional regulator [Proteus mirabilis]